MSLPEPEYLDWDRKRRVQLPSRAADDYMLVPVREFDRLLKRVEEELTPRYENESAAYFCLFGAAVATGASIPSLMTASHLPSWIIPTYIVSAAAFFLLGLALVFVVRDRKATQAKVTSDICREMRDIKELYHHAAGAPPADNGTESLAGGGAAGAGGGLADGGAERVDVGLGGRVAEGEAQ
jgi:hypothetical protein